MTAWIFEIQLQETETRNDQSCFHYLWLQDTFVWSDGDAKRT